jgi:hypothetical protein
MFSPSSLLLLLWDPGWIKIRTGINISDPQHYRANTIREKSVLPVFIDDNANASGTVNRNLNVT